MIEKLAESERSEQVFVRHAFRFWMGRNETLNDAPVLQAAHKAYRESGGSMKALITSASLKQAATTHTCSLAINARSALFETVGLPAQS